MYKKKGFFIVFEGVEGCGKSYQSKKLFNKLKKVNIPSILTREPGGTDSAELIRNLILKDYFNKSKNEKFDKYTDTLLYLAARNEHVLNKIIPALKKKKVIICDRFIDSTSAYQGYGRDMNLVNIGYLNKFAMQGVHPNFTFLIDISTQESTNRLNKSSLDRMELAGNDFYEKVRAGYIDLVKNFPERIFRIDGRLPIEDIHSKIINIINSK